MEGTILKIEIEQSTRQWLGVVIIGAVIAGMIFAGLIPAPEYQKYVGFVVGAFFYHVIRMLNGPGKAPEIQQQMHSVQGVPTVYEAPKVNPTQPPMEG